MAKITTLKDQSGGVLYPVTKTECVVDIASSFSNYYTKTESDNRYYTKTESDGRYYLNKNATMLIATNNNGTYTVTDLSTFNFILIAHKGSDGAWMTSIYPTSRIEGNQRFILENTAHSTWTVVQVNSYTSIKLEGANRQWLQVIGV